MHDPHKYLFSPKCRLPTKVSQSKESKEFFLIFRDKISILKIEKKMFAQYFPFSKSIIFVTIDFIQIFSGPLDQKFFEVVDILRKGHLIITQKIITLKLV